MPYTLAGFATDTRAAISGYAEGYHVGAASIARNVLFEAFWNHSVDLADANVVRTLLVDAIRTASPLTEDLHEWDYTGTLNGDQSASTRGLLIRRWAAEWQALEDPTVPLLVLADTDRLSGKSGIEWLGRELLKRRVELDPGFEPRLPPQRSVSDTAVSPEGRSRKVRFAPSEPQPHWPSTAVVGDPTGRQWNGRRCARRTGTNRSPAPPAAGSSSEQSPDHRSGRSCG